MCPRPFRDVLNVSFTWLCLCAWYTQIIAVCMVSITESIRSFLAVQSFGVGVAWTPKVNDASKIWSVSLQCLVFYVFGRVLIWDVQGKMQTDLRHIRRQVPGLTSILQFFVKSYANKSVPELKRGITWCRWWFYPQLETGWFWTKAKDCAVSLSKTGYKVPWGRLAQWRGCRKLKGFSACCSPHRQLVHRGGLPEFLGEIWWVYMLLVVEKGCCYVSYSARELLRFAASNPLHTSTHNMVTVWTASSL